LRAYVSAWVHVHGALSHVLAYRDLPTTIEFTCADSISCDVRLNPAAPWPTVRNWHTDTHGAAVKPTDADCVPCALPGGATCPTGFYTNLLVGECVPCPSTAGQYLFGGTLVLASVLLLVLLYRKTAPQSARSISTTRDKVKKQEKFHGTVAKLDSGLGFAKRRDVGRALVQINTSHLQVTTWLWTCDWQWPPFVKRLSELIGAFIQIDLNATARCAVVHRASVLCSVVASTLALTAALACRRPECTAVPRMYASTMSACFLMGIVLLVGLGLWAKYRCTKATDARYSEKRAHAVSFAVALYTLTFPLLVAQAVDWLDWERRDDGRWRSAEVPNVGAAQAGEMAVAFGLAGVWLLILAGVVPRRIYVSLRKHHQNGDLRSDEVCARLGWMHEKFTDKYHWHELVSRAFIAGFAASSA
jgi:hypothetical protein